MKTSAQPNTLATKNWVSHVDNTGGGLGPHNPQISTETRELANEVKESHSAVRAAKDSTCKVRLHCSLAVGR